MTAFLSFILAASYPNKYFYVKRTEYKKFAQMIGCDLDTRGSQVKNTRRCLNWLEITRAVLRNNKDFNSVHKMIVENYDYKDESMSWGTLIYFDVGSGRWTIRSSQKDNFMAIKNCKRKKNQLKSFVRR